MLNFLGAVGVGYLVASGVVTNVGLTGRGLVRAARRAVEGDFREAGVEALAALAAPALLSSASVSALVIEALGSAYDLAEEALGQGQDRSAEREAA
jgi:hypothetical protein